MWEIVEKYFDFKSKMDFVGLREELVKIGTAEAIELVSIVDEIMLMSHKKVLVEGECNYWLKRFLEMFHFSGPTVSFVSLKDIGKEVTWLTSGMSSDEMKYRMCTNLLLLNLYKESVKIKVFELMLNYVHLKLDNAKYFDGLVNFLVK